MEVLKHVVLSLYGNPMLQTFLLLNEKFTKRFLIKFFIMGNFILIKSKEDNDSNVDMMQH
jgi:hypothetical protein